MNQFVIQEFIVSELKVNLPIMLFNLFEANTKKFKYHRRVHNTKNRKLRTFRYISKANKKPHGSADRTKL